MNNNRGLIIVVLVATVMVLCSPAAAMVTSYPDNMKIVNEMESYEGNAEKQVRIAEGGFYTALGDRVGATLNAEECSIVVQVTDTTEDGIDAFSKPLHGAAYTDATKLVVFDRAGIEGAYADFGRHVLNVMIFNMAGTEEAYAKELGRIADRDVAAIYFCEAGSGFGFPAETLYGSAYYQGITWDKIHAFTGDDSLSAYYQGITWDKMKAQGEIREEIRTVTEARYYASMPQVYVISQFGYGMAMKDASGVGDALFEILHLDEIDNGREISQMGMSLNAVEYLPSIKGTVAPCGTEYRDATAVQAMEVLGGGFTTYPGIAVKPAELNVEIEKELVKEDAAPKTKNCVSMFDFSEASGFRMVSKDASGVYYTFANDDFGIYKGNHIAIVESVDVTLLFLEDMIPTSTIGYFNGTF